MNEGPTGPTPEETPPAPEPTPAPQPAAWEVPAHTPPPAAAEPAPYVPPPDYAAPPGYGAPAYGAPAAAPRRNMGPIVIAVVVVVVLLVAIIGYVAAGFAVAAGQISAADKTLNAVIANENAITSQFNAANALTLLDFKTATSAEFTQNKTASATVVTQSQSAQSTITSDDASLASADASLKNNSWLTALSKSSLDQKSAKIAHWRNALASAKTVTVDSVQLGNFVQAYDDTLIDEFTFTDAANATNFTGMASAIGSMKADVAKAIQLSGAPGLPADTKQFLTDVQTLATDTEKLLNDDIAGDSGAYQTDLTKFDADVTKADAHDIVAMNNAIDSFYKPLIDAYNSEVSKANAM